MSYVLKGYLREKKKPVGKTAAVLVPLIYEENILKIIFTKRHKRLNNHSGEVSFPGGSCENSDDTLRITALRETSEEIGIPPEYIKILGKLDDEYSITGYKVTPYVGFIVKNLNDISFNCDDIEVERVFAVPVRYFFDESVFWTENWVKDGEKRIVYFYKFEDLIIWGLTGRIVFKFLNIIKKCLI
nr:CoA pyrophosphatase [Deferribacter autotrophicus]